MADPVPRAHRQPMAECRNRCSHAVELQSLNGLKSPLTAVQQRSGEASGIKNPQKCTMFSLFRATAAEMPIRVTPPAATRSLPKRTGPVTKLGSEHGKDMPLDAKRRRIDRMAVPDLRHRRGGHQEGHQPEGHHPVATVSR